MGFVWQTWARICSCWQLIIGICCTQIILLLDRTMMSLLIWSGELVVQFQKRFFQSVKNISQIFSLEFYSLDRKTVPFSGDYKRLKRAPPADHQPKIFVNTAMKNVENQEVYSIMDHYNLRV